MISWFYWDPNPEFFSIPYFNFPILWYGVFFAVGFWISFLLFIRIINRYFAFQKLTGLEWEKKGQLIADKITVYIVIGTIVGARLGHFIFYEKPSYYLSDPLQLFLIRKGGLASHGAVIGIIIAVFLFCYRIQLKYPELKHHLTWLRILDFLAVPAAFTSSAIRVGNFFNQEILGKPTNVPWAVIFGHPIDHSASIPRHPVQLYEAVWYLAIFFLLWRLSYKPFFLLVKGRLVGLLLILIFTFRFFIEFLKEEQSYLLTSFSVLTMAQILSIPVIFLGFLFYYRNQ